MKKNIQIKGIMMVEIIVAVSIITLSVLAAMSVVQKSIYLSRQALHTSQAAFLLEEGAEVVRIVRDNSWTNISGLTVGSPYYPQFSGGAWSLSSTPSAVGIFTRTVVTANIGRDPTTGDIGGGLPNDSGTKLITVTVSWPEGSNTITKTLQFYIMDIFSS